MDFNEEAGVLHSALTHIERSQSQRSTDGVIKRQTIYVLKYKTKIKERGSIMTEDRKLKGIWEGKEKEG